MADPYSAAAMASLQLMGGYFQNENMRNAAKLNQQIAEMNAEFAELDAYKAIVGGQTSKARYQSVVDKTLATTTANITAADVDITYGSAAELVKENRFIAELNKMEIDKQAQEAALGYRQQARDYRVQGASTASAQRRAGAEALTQGFLGASKEYAGSYKEINAGIASGYEKVVGTFSSGQGEPDLR